MFDICVRSLKYDTIEEFNVDSKADYSALSSTSSLKNHWCAVPAAFQRPSLNWKYLPQIPASPGSQQWRLCWNLQRGNRPWQLVFNYWWPPCCRHPQQTKARISEFTTARSAENTPCDWTFTAAGSRLWNSLPRDITNCRNTWTLNSSVVSYLIVCETFSV